MNFWASAGGAPVSLFSCGVFNWHLPTSIYFKHITPVAAEITHHFQFTRKNVDSFALLLHIYFHVLGFDFKELYFLHAVYLILEPQSSHCFVLQTRISKVLTQASAVHRGVETNRLWRSSVNSAGFWHRISSFTANPPSATGSTAEMHGRCASAGRQPRTRIYV